VIRTRKTYRWSLFVVLVALLTGLPPSLTAQIEGAADSALKIVTARDGVELHYEERGQGIPVIFVHGSLSDGSY
jgi:hypothetical protein